MDAHRGRAAGLARTGAGQSRGLALAWRWNLAFAPTTEHRQGRADKNQTGLTASTKPLTSVLPTHAIDPKVYVTKTNGGPSENMHCPAVCMHLARSPVAARARALCLRVLALVPPVSSSGHHRCRCADDAMGIDRRVYSCIRGKQKLGSCCFPGRCFTEQNNVSVTREGSHAITNTHEPASATCFVCSSYVA
jgi:hypothetical protein